MKFKKILIACLLILGLTGFTTNYTSHATSNAIKYENEGNDTYISIYNNGKGAAGGLGIGPAPLNKSQAEKYNAIHDPDEKPKVSHDTNHQLYTPSNAQNNEQNNSTSTNNSKQSNDKKTSNKKIHEHSKKTSNKFKAKTKSIKNSKHHNKRNYILYAIIAMVIVACLGALRGIIKK